MLSLITLALAATVAAVPLNARGGGDGYGSCSSDCQYSCSTTGLANVLTCDSILNGNTISIPISVLKRDEAAAPLMARGGSDGTPTCCTTYGLLNILTCTDLLDGNTISVPISLVSGL